MNLGTTKSFFLKIMTTIYRSYLLRVSKTPASSLRRFGLLLALALGLPANMSAASNNAAIGKVYATPEEAIADLKTATANADTNAIRTIFGPAVDALENPYRVQATNDYAKFSAALSATNHLVRVSNTRIVLEAGNDSWPFPVPLVKEGEGSAFRTRKRARKRSSTVGLATTNSRF